MNLKKCIYTLKDKVDLHRLIKIIIIDSNLLTIDKEKK